MAACGDERKTSL